MASILRARAIPVTREKAETIVRFDIHQRIQHIMMFTSFITLAFTGLPQKFSSWAASQWWVGVLGGSETVRTIHHYAAFVMIACCMYHIGYITFSTIVLRRPFPFWMIPNLKDVMDFIKDMKYFVGLSKEEPRFDRFSYREKFDYWAVFWGMAIIGGSGIIMMFPVFFTKFLPGTVIPVALVAHSDEAILAVGWIFIVHFYFAHFAPRVFPLNTSIFTGKVRKALYKIEHPVEYERMFTKQEVRPADLVNLEAAPQMVKEEATEAAVHEVSSAATPPAAAAAPTEVEESPSEQVPVA